MKQKQRANASSCRLAEALHYKAPLLNQGDRSSGLFKKSNLTDWRVSLKEYQKYWTRGPVPLVLSIMLVREGELWQFRMITEEGLWHDPEMEKNFSYLAQVLSEDVFNNEPVEIHICNEFFITKNIAAMAD